MAFLSLVAKLMPAEIRASLEGAVPVVEVRSYTGLAWENEAQRFAAEKRVAAIEAELELEPEHTTNVTAIQAEVPDPEPAPGPEPKARKITIIRPWEDARQRSALNWDG